MRRIILLTIGWYACAFWFVSFAQEIKTDTLHGVFPEKETPSLQDTSLFKLNLISNPMQFLESNTRLFRDSAMFSFEKLDLNERKKAPKPILPWELGPDLSFNIVPSRWDLPLLGPTITFAPTLSYHLSDKMLLYGGIGFTQYPNLSFAQSRIFPDGPSARSNITTQAFGGIAYALHDRITLRGSYQHSLYNPLPSNLMMFAPGYNVINLGADVDVWKGLGVSVRRVWEFDQYGRSRQYMQYSPYINIDKFMKFLGF